MASSVIVWPFVLGTTLLPSARGQPRAQGLLRSIMGSNWGSFRTDLGEARGRFRPRGVEGKERGGALSTDSPPPTVP